MWLMNNFWEKIFISLFWESHLIVGSSAKVFMFLLLKCERFQFFWMFLNIIAHDVVYKSYQNCCSLVDLVHRNRKLSCYSPSQGFWWTLFPCPSSVDSPLLVSYISEAMTVSLCGFLSLSLSLAAITIAVGQIHVSLTLSVQHQYSRTSGEGINGIIKPSL